MAISTAPTGCPLHVTSVSVRPIAAAEEEAWDALMAQGHPLGNPHFPGHQLKYVAEHRGQAVALLCFSGSAYHLADRDRWIGWSLIQALRRRQFIVQNSRFLLLPDPPPPNLASRVLAQCARRLPEDWRRRFGFAPGLLETFVDPVHFRGTCYQAAGWSKVGQTRGFRRDGHEFYAADSHPKDIWMKELRTDARAALRAETVPEEWQAFERELPLPERAGRFHGPPLSSLYERLWALPDPRGQQGRRYPLACGLAIVVCAVLAGCKGLRECAEFGASLSQPQLRALRCWLNRKTRRYVAPQHVTLWRLVSGVDAGEFEAQVQGWLAQEEDLPRGLALDGKALRATLLNADGGAFVVSAAAPPDTPLFSPRSSRPGRAAKWPRPRP